jgi:hypothetical protein
VIAPTVPTPAPVFTVADSTVRPSDEWLRAIAVMLLADVERDQDQEGDEELVETWN